MEPRGDGTDPDGSARLLEQAEIAPLHPVEPLGVDAGAYVVASEGGNDEDVEYARHHFESLRRLYARAARLGLGVGISYG